MPDWLTNTFTDSTTLSTNVLVTRLLAAFAFGCTAAAVHYMTAPRNRVTDRSFLATMVMLAILIAVVTIVIGNNIARAFSLAGVLAIVRFRSVVSDTRDTAFVIYAVVTGLAVGSGYFLEPFLVTPLFMLAAWMFRSDAGVKLPSHGSLILRYSTTQPLDDKIQELLSKHVPGHHLTGLSTARSGSAYEFVYSIQLPPADKVFALVNELARIEGMQGVEIKGP